MLRLNRARLSEFQASYSSIQADRLNAARIAFISGTATEDQIALVEEANRRAEEEGGKLPPLMSSPRRPRESEAAQTSDATQTEELADPSSKSWWQWWR